ncbi:MAG: HPr family phosphocarrier protein [Candidatus Marinimicrobia bacterium]|nr:HPr family phosphocarrier protein [Candidatus Neomarinimicrobiota bacterium]
MVQQTVIIINKYGLHTRPATVFVTQATKFKSDIFVIYNGVRVNAKSILGLLILAVEPGAEITIEADGNDEKEAIEKLVALTKNKFNLG